jgi:hypothetical protein
VVPQIVEGSPGRDATSIGRPAPDAREHRPADRFAAFVREHQAIRRVRRIDGNVCRQSLEDDVGERYVPT